MMTYGRTGKNSTQNPAQEPVQAAKSEEQIPIDGFMQVIEMLEHADPVFRESLLRRIQIRDAGMAAQLRQTLAMR